MPLRLLRAQVVAPTELRGHKSFEKTPLVPDNVREEANPLRQFLVEGAKKFKINVPDDAKVTFGPFSPPSKGDRAFGGGGGYEHKNSGTLRIYRKTKDNIIACFSGVTSFRELDMDYQEEVAVEEGARIWKSDQHGYSREEKISSKKEWVDAPALPEGEDV